MKENNVLLEENIHVDENKLATSEEWKLPYKSLWQTEIHSLQGYFNVLYLNESLPRIPVKNKNLHFRYAVFASYNWFLRSLP